MRWFWRLLGWRYFESDVVTLWIRGCSRDEAGQRFAQLCEAHEGFAEPWRIVLEFYWR